MCVWKVAGVSPDRRGHGALAGQRRTPCRGDSVSVLVSLSHHKTSRLWTLAQDIILEWEQRKKRRFGGGAPCESRKTVFCVPCLVASDSCHDQASAWLLGDVAETEQSSSVAGVRVMYFFHVLYAPSLVVLFFADVFFFNKTKSKSLNDVPVTSFCSTRTCCCYMKLFRSIVVWAELCFNVVLIRCAWCT